MMRNSNYFTNLTSEASILYDYMLNYFTNLTYNHIILCKIFKIFLQLFSQV